MVSSLALSRVADPWELRSTMRRRGASREGEGVVQLLLNKYGFPWMNEDFL